MSRIDYRNIEPLDEREFEQIAATFASEGTTATVARDGVASTTYLLEPRVWIRDVIDAGKKDFHYAQFAIQTNVPKGNRDAIFIKRNKMLSGSAWQASITPGDTSTVNYTALDNNRGIEVTPTWKNYAVKVGYDVIQQNAVNYVTQARDELTYRAGDEVDLNVVDTLSGSTLSTSAVFGTQMIFGGTATQSSELAAGEVFTVDMIAEGRRKLESSNCRYWTAGTGEGLSSDTKNPWKNKNDFTIIIAPEQQEQLRTSSQFVNVSEYGSANIIRGVADAEIGDYLGVRVLTSNNTVAQTSGGDGPDESTTATDTNTCMMFKSKKHAGLAFLKKPTLHVVDDPQTLAVDLILEQAYESSMIHDDALVHINVAQI
ncbi:MAG: hypothetical protein ACW991_00740 [Candidatus Hodarchaeales archaeon]|jgi:N4-gp56 family major capsid protein